MSWRRIFEPPAARRVRRDRERALADFREELDAAAGRPHATTGVPAGLEDGLVARLAARADELGLTDENGALELELIDGLRELAALARAVERGGLPLLETHHRVLAGEPCRFSAPATRLVESDGAEGTPGRLFLTDRRILFLGATVAGVSWSAIAAVARSGRDVELTGQGRRHRFRLNTFADALRAVWLAGRLR